MEYNWALIKIDWLAASIALRVVSAYCISHFPPESAYNFHSPPANRKEGAISEEMSQTLLTNKSKEIWTKYTPLTLLSQHKLALTSRNTLFAL